MSQVVIGDILPYTQAIAILNQTVFGTNWTADAASDVVVYKTPSGDPPNDVTQILPYPAGYSVAFIGAEQEVQVTLVVPAGAGDIVTVTRQTPADRENLYSNTNFTPSMLNSDFGILTLVDQQAQLVDQKIGPRYNYSAVIVNVVDTILPILEANQGWVKNPSDTAIIGYTFPSSGIAPAGATYVTVTDETSTLPNSFPLTSAGDGILVNNTGTGTLIGRQITGTTHQINVANPTGLGGNIGLSISDNPILPGTAGMGIPSGTTGQRVIPVSNISLRFNTTINQLEYWDGGTWTQINNDTEVLPGNINDLAYYAATGAQVSPLSTVNNGVLITDSGGVPTWKTGTFAILGIGGGPADYFSASLNGAIAQGFTALTPAFTPYSLPSTTLTANELLYASSTTAVTQLATANNGVLVTSNTGVPSILAGPGFTGRVLTSNAAAAPSWSTSTFPTTGGAAGNILISDGTNYIASTSLWPNTVGSVGKILRSDGTVNAYSTSTFADTYGVSTLLYASSANAVSGLATVNSAALVTNGSGVPSWQTMTAGQVLIGTTAGAPVAAAINSGTGILVGNASGSITVNLAAIADHTLLANISGGALAPSSTTLTALIDNAIGSVQGDLLYRNASSWVVLAPGTSGQLLKTGGAAANPSWTTATFPGTAGAAGTILRSDGTNWLASTSTFADTYAISTLLYASSANTIVGLATANNSVLVTSAGGVPSLSTTLPSGLAATNMHLTTPFITTSLLDTNGVTWIAQIATASAVNYITVANQIAGTAPSIGATGSDTNIALVLNGKGTSGAKLQGSTGGATPVAGYTGETKHSNISSGAAVSLSNNTVADVTSLNCGSGNWLVFGNVSFVSNTGTSSYAVGWTNSTSVTQPDASLFCQIHPLTSSNDGMAVPTQLYSFGGGGGTVYLSVVAGVSVAMKACGDLTAIRMP